MNVALQIISLLGILSLTLSSLTGCGEKRANVSTLSGTPGEQMDVTPPETTTSVTNESGLEEPSVDESTITSQDSSLANEFQLEEIPPLTHIEPINFAHEPSPQISPEETPIDTSSSTNSMTDGSPQSDESTQDLSSDLLTEENFSDDPLEQEQDFSSNQFSEGQDFTTQPSSSDRHDPMLGQADTLPLDPSMELQDTIPDQNGEMEQVPEEPFQLAKASPSETIQEQLDKIQQDELTTAAIDLEDVFFHFDSWSLTAEGKNAAERGKQVLENEGASKLIIEGHADVRGTQAYNMVLGKKRAVAIRDYLTHLGVDPSRLAVISFGKDKPFCIDETEVCHQLNRRGHLLVQKP